jgi:ABC-type sugar transport system ATPase subunit
MLDLRLDHIGKTFPPSRHVLEDITLTVGAGECLALLGPSGCGKTTLLRIIAGLEQPSSGDVVLGGQDVKQMPSHRRNVAMLFQRPALVPTQTVRRSLRWSWTLREPWALWRRPSDPREQELERVARLLELERDLERPVQELSGGQQQRVALGRCLLRKAPICLLDEPLGHLDAPLRVELRRQIRALARAQAVTLIHVTHDPEEALAVGDRVAVINEGRIVQIDEPAVLLRSPRNRCIAELVHQHQGGLNLLAGTITREGDRAFFDSAFGRWPIPEALTFGNYKNFHPEPGKFHIILGIAACDVRCDAEHPRQTGEIRLTMPVLQRECSSAGTWIIAGDGRSRWIGRGQGFEQGNEVTMSFSMERGYWFDGITGQTLCAPAG